MTDGTGRNRSDLKVGDRNLLPQLFLLTAWLTCAAPASESDESRLAPLRVFQLFSDGMVMQRDVAVPVWGWSDRRDTVQVTFDGKSYRATPDKDGSWSVQLPAFAAGGPYTMTIGTKDTSVLVRDVLVGDVWLCAGQSNMEWDVRLTTSAEQEIAAAQDPRIRHFKVARGVASMPATTLAGGTWRRTTPQTVGRFTAVGYYFARELRKTMDVPIGLINASVSGTSVKYWAPSGKPQSDNIPSNESGGWPPGGLYNKMIHPLQRYPIKGVLYYQGEADSRPPANAAYAGDFTTLIARWRARRLEDVPFLFVQIPNFRSPDALPPLVSDLAVLRESQSAALQLPNVGMAVTYDIGEPVGGHPRNKQDFSVRLALLARRLAYGEAIVASGPRYLRHESRAGRIVIEFTDLGGGLKTARHGDKLEGFAIAGADRRFEWAEAAIEGDRVAVWSRQIPQPVTVRYAWSDNPDRANLANKEGFLAAPFRTDDW